MEGPLHSLPIGFELDARILIPCLHFLKRLVSKGLKAIFVTTNFIYKTIKPKL
ncbi:hypothetical protein MKW92_022807, partial [Papaver armeniacum]